MINTSFSNYHARISFNHQLAGETVVIFYFTNPNICELC